MMAGVEDPQDTPLRRFERSMVIDYEKWHDGIGYDLEALRSASPGEREAIEKMLLARRGQDWRDIEALAELNTPHTRECLKAAIRHGNAEIRAAVTQYAPELISDSERITSLVQALETAKFYGGLTQTLDQIESFHPPEVMEALFHGALNREGDVAVHFAAMLAFVHGHADSAFDMGQRPFFLRFNTPARHAREFAFRELCDKIGVNADKYLKRNTTETQSHGDRC